MPEAAISLCVEPRAVSASRREAMHGARRTGLTAALALVLAFLLLADMAAAREEALQAAGTVLKEQAGAAATRGGMLLADASVPQAASSAFADVPAQTGGSGKPEWVEKFFRGSFLGSFFFAYPYSGVGLPDIVVMIVAALLALRLILRKLTGRKKDGYALAKEQNSARSRQRFTDSRIGGKKGAAAEARDEHAAELGEAYPRGTLTGARKAQAGAGQRQGEALGKEGPEDVPASRQTPQARRSGGMDTVLGQWASVAPGVTLPPGFDAAYFLEWARSLYISLQYSWAERQVDSLETYVSREMFGVLKAQAAKDPHPVPIDIQFVHARLAGVRHNDHWAQVGIQFTVSMSSGAGSKPVEIRETWRFVCGGEDNSWRVEAIEQA